MEHQTSAGLRWDIRGFIPDWEHEPDEKALVQVCREALTLSKRDECTAILSARYDSSRLYRIETSQGKYGMRICMPVCPRDKTGGEMTTLSWIRRNTQVPVAKVIDDDTQDNAIGFEWNLMELVPGVPLSERWDGLSMADKTWVVEQIADFQAQLFRRSLEDGKARELFFADHFGCHGITGIRSGPYRSNYSCLATLLDIIDQQKRGALKIESDSRNRENIEEWLRVREKLGVLAVEVFPAVQIQREQTVIWHGKLTPSNIWIEQDDAKITAIADWECVSCAPFWVASQFPAFLLGPTREEEPEREQYGFPSHGELGSEGDGDSYRRHMQQFESTQLRKVYAAKMKKLWPQWEMEERNALLKVDLLTALRTCSYGRSGESKRVKKWIDDALISAYDGRPSLIDTYWRQQSPILHEYR